MTYKLFSYRVTVKGGLLWVTVIIEVNTVNKNGIETVLDLKEKENMSSSLLSLTSDGFAQVRMFSAVE